MEDGDEFEAATDPRNSHDALRVTGLKPGRTPGSWDLTWSSIPGRRYALEISNDSQRWAALPGIYGAIADHVDASVTVQNTGAWPGTFIRVRVLPE